jgi:drug/metabolite transporter (DMT)-like permease
LGNVLLLTAVIAGTAFNILSKENFKKFDASTIIGFSFVIGAFSFLPFALWETWHNPSWAAGISIESFLGLVFLAVFASLIAYLIYEWSMEKLPVSRTLPMTFIQPVVTVVVAVPLLHEKITNVFVIGSILILAGMYLATFDKPHHHHRSAHHKV